MIVAGDEPSRIRDFGGGEPGLDHRRQQVAQQHQGACPVPVMRLITHLDHLGQDRGDVDWPVPAHRGLKQGAEHGRHPAQPLDHVRRVRAIPQYLAQALIERAVRAPPVGRVLQNEHPHRRRDHAGHRTDGTAVMTWFEANNAQC